MLRGNNKKIIMTKGDYGIDLPITINGIYFKSGDSLKFIIKKYNDNEELIAKTFSYSDITEKTINLNLTEQESELLPVGFYRYGIDYYIDDVFMCNLVTSEDFIVEDKV